MEQHRPDKVREKPCRKAINFDLITHNLKKQFGENRYQNGYYEITRFMLKNGFSHRQYSGYVSNKELCDFDVIRTIKQMKRKMPWLKDCVRVIDMTNVGDIHDLTDIIKGKKRSSQQQRQQQQSKVTYKPIITRKVQPGMKLHR